MPICQLPCQLSEQCQEIEVGYEFNDEVALSTISIKESDTNYNFPLKSNLEVRDQFTIKLEHLKSAVALWGTAEYFHLKYLLALLLQIATSKYNYALTNIGKAFPLLYDICIVKFAKTAESEPKEIRDMLYYQLK